VRDRDYSFDEKRETKDKPAKSFQLAPGKLSLVEMILDSSLSAPFPDSLLLPFLLALLLVVHS